MRDTFIFKLIRIQFVSFGAIHKLCDKWDKNWECRHSYSYSKNAVQHSYSYSKCQFGRPDIGLVVGHAGVPRGRVIDLQKAVDLV